MIRSQVLPLTDLPEQVVLYERPVTVADVVTMVPVLATFLILDAPMAVVRRFALHFATFEVHVVNDADYDSVEYGGGTTAIDCWTVRMPYLSTDTARVAVTFTYGAAMPSILCAPLMIGKVGDDHPDGEAEETIDLTHPFGVSLGQVIVDRDDVDALAR